MYIYRVNVGNNGEIVLPPEMRELLGLVSGDILELTIDLEGKTMVRPTERSVTPLADFFEDLILNDLQGRGWSGDTLKERFLERKIQMSTVLDRLAQEAARALQQGQTMSWREILNLKVSLGETEKGEYKVILTTRAERDLLKMPGTVLQEIPQVFASLEKDPLAFKRLRGPYYETYRVSLNGTTNGRYRVIYTVFADKGFVAILCIGDRRDIYEHLKGMA